MKNHVLLLIGFILAFQPRSLPASSDGPPASDEIERRIERVINGLFPSSVLRNQNR